MLFLVHSSFKCCNPDVEMIYIFYNVLLFIKRNVNVTWLVLSPFDMFSCDLPHCVLAFPPGVGCV